MYLYIFFKLLNNRVKNKNGFYGSFDWDPVKEETVVQWLIMKFLEVI